VRGKERSQSLNQKRKRDHIVKKEKQGGEEQFLPREGGWEKVSVKRKKKMVVGEGPAKRKAKSNREHCLGLETKGDQYQQSAGGRRGTEEQEATWEQKLKRHKGKVG